MLPRLLHMEIMANCIDFENTSDLETQMQFLHQRNRILKSQKKQRGIYMNVLSVGRGADFTDFLLVNSYSARKKSGKTWNNGPVALYIEDETKQNFLSP